jgi:UDP-N-acetylglucosamine 2-epimerase (non-hydrolysing)
MLLICFGTRPEWLKIKPIVNLLNKDEYKLLFTGQHKELLKEIDFDERLYITEGRNRLDNIVSDILKQFPDGNDSVLVQGDTASAFACALAAFHRGMKIYYLEAGLRTYNLKEPYPEEGYRQMIARISDVNFCPTEFSETNLFEECVLGTNYIVGNTSLDNLLDYKDRVIDGKKVLVTLHRRENHEDMHLWFSAIYNLSLEHPELEFIVPIHPNPNVIKWKGLLNNNNIKVVPPMEHKDLLDVMVECSMIITDSGGIQEEATFLDKKVVVCRNKTERPEGIISRHLFLCGEPDKLKDTFNKVLLDDSKRGGCIFGDGHSSEKIVKILRKK